MNGIHPRLSGQLFEVFNQMVGIKIKKIKKGCFPNEQKHIGNNINLVIANLGKAKQQD